MNGEYGAYQNVYDELLLSGVEDTIANDSDVLSYLYERFQEKKQTLPFFDDIRVNQKEVVHSRTQFQCFYQREL
ncbi:hypothetical protein EDM52_14690 [Brevibacillus invocatus]|uniref:Uncharacterized protein n=1 Tax=Brevibacillus invocatus TaxID=173959 RepID=A0A3M8C8R0_9BACL|nr:hypothetical protein EDM52_14690 [Brevibacillus invocatus]